MPVSDEGHERRRLRVHELREFNVQYQCFACSRYVNVGLTYLRQISFAKFDIKVHTDKGENINFPLANNVPYPLIYNRFVQRRRIIQNYGMTSGPL